MKQNIDEDEIDMEDIAELAECSSELLEIANEYSLDVAIRGLSTSLAMLIVNSAPSKKEASSIVRKIKAAMIHSVEVADELGFANWSEEDGLVERTLQ